MLGHFLEHVEQLLLVTHASTGRTARRGFQVSEEEAGRKHMHGEFWKIRIFGEAIGLEGSYNWF
jgi:hypothetical protein